MHEFLIGLAILAGWLLSLYLCPTKACGCAGRCGRCKSTGRRFRFGARLIHRGAAAGYRQARRRRANRWK
jgi:hypothetical protein